MKVAQRRLTVSLKRRYNVVTRIEKLKILAKSLREQIQIRRAELTFKTQEHNRRVRRKETLHRQKRRKREIMLAKRRESRLRTKILKNAVRYMEAL